MNFVKDKLDPDQMGGQDGHSIAHYLIEVTNFILYNQDLKDPQAIIAVMVDFSQGFNRIKHSTLIEILSTKMNVPGWLLRIMISYLSERKLRVRFKGAVSEEKDLFSGAGQGCLLGLWCFLFLINFAGPEREVGSLGNIITKPLNARKPLTKMKAKWIDDLTIMSSVNLKTQAVHNPDHDAQRPLNFHNRTEHMLPNHHNMLQKEVWDLQQYANDHSMVINQEKTKVAIFNPLKNIDIMPEICLQQGSQNIEVVEQFKLLGQIISTDMKTIHNTLNICTKAYTRMWVIRRLKGLGCPREELLDVLKHQILSVVEQAVPYWAPMITKNESQILERILKTALHIILQDEYISFRNALKITKMKSLSDRRKEAIFKFCKNAEKSDAFNRWFSKAETSRPTRNSVPLYRPVSCRTTRYERSSIPAMTKILSWHPPKNYIAPVIY